MKRNIIIAFYLIISSMILSNCTKDNSPWSEEENASSNVYFRVTVNTLPGNLSRSFENSHKYTTPKSRNVYFEEGSDFENAINVDNLQLFVYKTDNNTYVGKIKKLKYIGTNTTSQTAYEFRGQIPKDELAVNTEYKFMVLANSHLFIPSSLKLIFDQEDLTNSIPMWGVKKFTLTPNASGALEKEYNLEVVDMLRASAKANVSLGDEIKDSYSLQSVSINYCNETGNVLPKNWAIANQTADITGPDLTKSDETIIFNPIDQTTPKANFKFNPITNTEGKNLSFYAYLPEYTNTAEKEAIISVTLKDGNGNLMNYNNHVKFRDYENGKIKPESPIYNIVRNNYYKFIITGVGTDLELICKVLPWDLYEETWDYTNQISVSQEMNWQNGTIITESSEAIFDGKGSPMTVNFQIDTPKGATWYATFVPIEGNVNAFTFIKPDNSTVNIMEGPVGKKAELKIKPLDVNNVQTNKAVLRIFVKTLDGRTIPANSVSGTKNEYTIVQPIK